MTVPGRWGSRLSAFWQHFAEFFTPPRVPSPRLRRAARRKAPPHPGPDQRSEALAASEGPLDRFADPPAWAGREDRYVTLPLTRSRARRG